MTLVNKKELDTFAAQGCSSTDCNHEHGPVFIHSKCHVEAPLEASYVRGSGVLRVACFECSADIMNVEVSNPDDDLTKRLKAFARWVLYESAEGGDVDGGCIFEKAVETGLVVERPATKEDCETEQGQDYGLELGEPWHIITESLDE